MAEAQATVRFELSGGFVLTARLTDEQARVLMHSIPSGSQIRKYRPEATEERPKQARPRKLGATVVRPQGGEST